jgi:hypothetical protein
VNNTQYIGKLVKDRAGNEVKLTSFKELKELGANYGVKYFPKENMHWSDTGDKGMVFRKFISLGLLLISAGCSSAQDLPVVGLWEKIPVSDGVGKPVARTSYIFTNVKLTQPVTFSGLRDIGSGMDVLCCVEVKNLTPLRVSEVVDKYKIDPEFGNKIKSIKGLPFMYEAVPVTKAKRNESFQTVMDTDTDPADVSPYSSAVISADLGKAKTLKSPFRSGTKNISLVVKYPKKNNLVVYEFKIDTQSTVFSESAEPH